MKNNNWNTIEYQKIESAILDGNDLTVCFSNGDCTTLPLSSILPLGTEQVVKSSLRNNEYDIYFNSEQGDIYIPWDKIRVLTDEEFAKHTAKMADENSKLVGARIKSLRERKRIKSAELADRAGVTPQTITRIERGHTDVSFATLRKILAAMGYGLKDLAYQELEASKVQTVNTYQTFIKKLNNIGINSNLISKIIPVEIREKINNSNDNIPELVQSEISAYLSRIFDWNQESLWTDEDLKISDSPAKLAFFKTPTKGNLIQIKAYSHYAFYLAQIVSKINVAIPKLEYPGNIEEFVQSYNDNYKGLTLKNLINFAWDLGISIIPLNDHGVFHGASWNIKNKHVIILKQRNESHARWIYDLLHELYHVFAHLETENTSIIETEELNPFNNNDNLEEMEANSFANKIIFGERAEDIANKVLENANFKVEYLKTAINKVSKTEKVTSDFIANYLAFRLQASHQNIWGVANFFQVITPSPFDLTSDILKERISIDTLNPLDKNILTTAISN